jgi:hypothetical protein
MADRINQYFKKTLPEFKILIQIEPKSLSGLELIIETDKKIKKTKRIFEADIYDDLEADEFETCSPLEFNLYLKGLVK